MTSPDTGFKQYFKEFFDAVLNEDDEGAEDGIPEKDKPKITALKKKEATDSIKTAGQVEKSMTDTLKAKEVNFSVVKKDSSVANKDNVSAAKDSVEKAKQALLNTKKRTLAAKIKLSSIK